MKRKIALVCGVLFKVYPLAQSEQDIGPFVGSKSQGPSPEYHLNYTFGVEQWENGKPAKFRHEQWRLLCTCPEPVTGQQNTWCSLERLVIDKWDKQMKGAIITTHKHYSSEGTLKLLNVDWQHGKIDFSVVYDDNGTTEVMFRFKTTAENSLYLDSFKAVGIARGTLSDTMTPIEYKIPQYTYILNVPVEMSGFKSIDDKKWDDMFATLSKQDQISWKEFKQKSDKCINIFDYEEERILKDIIPNYEKRKTEIDKGGSLTPEEKILVDKYVVDIFAKCISESNISIDGKEKILDLIRQDLP